MDTIAIVLIIIIAVFIVGAVCIIAYSLLSSNRSKPSEIHYSGGANIDDGRLTSDSNYFKGLSGALEETAVIGENRRQTSGFGFYITLTDMSNGREERLAVKGELVLGRAADRGVYVVNDTSVSRRHCMFAVNNRRLYLSDLGSSNHTYLNGKPVTDPVEVHSGDTIKIGNTRLSVKF